MVDLHITRFVIKSYIIIIHKEIMSPIYFKDAIPQSLTEKAIIHTTTAEKRKRVFTGTNETVCKSTKKPL